MKEEFLLKKLEERKEQNAFRSLRMPGGAVDFCSNDYLGIVRNNLLHHSTDDYSYGSTGSRLLSGNYELIESTEKFIADFHHAAAGLIFNSGYDANLALLSCIPQRGDTILYDQLCHASIRDGIRLSFADSHAFIHNDCTDLEKKLQSAKGNIFVVTESVFSMDGDMAPLNEIVLLCHQYEAGLIVDEAHATGVVGDKGEGLVQQLNLQNDILARMHTFGKAVGCHGAIVLGSDTLRNYLINFARPFIYTTSLPEAAIIAIRTSYEVFPALSQERKHLSNLVSIFQSAATRYDKLPSSTAIQIVIVPGNAAVKELAAQLREHKLDVRPIVYPTVPKEKERLRIVLHAFNTEEEVHLLTNLLQ